MANARKATIPEAESQLRYAVLTLWHARRAASGQYAIVAAVLIGWALALTAYGQSQELTPERTPKLGPRQAQVFEFGAQGSLTVALSVQAAKRVELLIETGAPVLTFSVQAPSGSKVLSLTPEQSGWMAVSFAVTEPGAYRLIATTTSTLGSAPVKSEPTTSLRFRVELLSVSSALRERHVGGESLYAEAEKLRNSELQADVRSAIAKYRQAAFYWGGAGNHEPRHKPDREPEILALAGEARSWLELSQYQSAAQVLDHALALSVRARWLRAWLLSLHAQILLDEWEGKLAETYARESLSLATGLNDPWLRADALEVRGEALYVRHASSSDGKILPGEKSAEDYLGEALQLGRSSGAALTIARTLRCQSWLVEDQGSMTHAIALMQQAQEFFRGAGDVRDAFDTMQDIIAMEAVRGDSFSALKRLAELEPHSRGSGNEANYGFQLLNMGSEYAQLNRFPDAIQSYEKARKILEGIHHLSGLAASYGLLCAAYVRANDLKSASENCRKSTVVDKRLDDPKRQGLSEYWLAKVLFATGRAEQAIAAYRLAFAYGTKVNDNHNKAQVAVDWGDALESLNRQDEARALYLQAVAFSANAEEPDLRVEARFRIAQSDARVGRTSEATSELKAILEEIETYRKSVGNESLQASYFAAVRKCYQLYVDILMRAPNRTQDSEALALEISESSRARSLLDSLAARRLTLVPGQREGAPAKLMGLRFAMEQAYERRLALMLEGGHRRELQENLTDLIQATDALERAEDNLQNLANKSEDKVAAATVHPLNAKEILEASKYSSATMLEYSLGAERSYLWVVRNGTLKSHVLPGRKDVEDLVGRWRALAAAGSARQGSGKDLARVAAKLSCVLLDGRIEREIGSEPGPLAIVADGDLAMVPFAALPESGCGGEPGPPILVSHQVVMTPSISIYLMQKLAGQADERRTAFPREVAIVADPVFDAQDDRVQGNLRVSKTAYAAERSEATPPNVPAKMRKPRFTYAALPRLFESGVEAHEILAVIGPEKATLWMGFNASVETVLSSTMRDYRILHLATHGVFDENSPGFSGLVFSLVSPEGSPVFGYLKARDIANLDLHSDLVVLSACDSSAGNNLSGEGVTGLPYAFLHAGVRQVVSTLWNVDDETSRELMVEFYKEIFVDRREPAEALRRSQLDIMKSGHRSAPYYWAGFEITSLGN